MRRVAFAAMAIVGCGSSSASVATPTVASSASSAPAPSATPSAGAAPAASAAAPAATAPTETACQRDADCTFVSLGCCSTTPVSRAAAVAVKMRLAASGLPYCAVKAACGPGPEGTWEGAPGTCVRGACTGGP